LKTRRGGGVQKKSSEMGGKKEKGELQKGRKVKEGGGESKLGPINREIK